MANTYTVSSCFLENADIYDITGVLDELSNKIKGHYIAKDANGEIFDIYRKIQSKHYNDLILTWLEKLAREPKSITPIKVDLSQIDCIKEKFLTLCANTADKILIVHSRDNYTVFEIEEQKVIIQNKSIKVLNKKEAQEELNRVNSANYYVSGSGNMIAGENITNSKNKSK